MAQIDDLRSAVADLGAELSAAVTRVVAKLEELGEPDPDMTPEILALRSATNQLRGLGAPPPAEPPA